MLIASCYQECQNDLFNEGNNQRGFYYIYTGSQNENVIPRKEDLIFFKGNGDFRNKENIALLQKADVVVTNPPFSLFREYVAQLIQYDKTFLIIGNINAIT